MTPCPDELELARALSDGEAPPHLEVCAACRAAWDGLAAAIELARKLPVSLPPADRREEMRTAILAASSRAPAPARGPSSMRRWWLAGAALAAAVAAAVLVVVVRPSSGPIAHAHGTVSGAPGARYIVASTSPDEIVMLHDGTIDVEVSPLHAGERFRVITNDSEIEVRGTAFRVESRSGHVTAVRVRHGLVEVRPIGGPIARVGAGEAWDAPVVHTAAVEPIVPPSTPAVVPVKTVAIAAPVPPMRAATPSPARTSRPLPAIVERPAAAVAPAAIARSPQAVAYDEAWTAMRAGDFAKASSAFARAGILDPDGALAEDASYWYPVALAREKRPEAVTAFREFLDRYPRSAHAHEASAMLGWLLVDANQRAEAERRFRVALDDPRAEVSRSARAGLAALGVTPPAGAGAPPD